MTFMVLQYLPQFQILVIEIEILWIFNYKIIFNFSRFCKKLKKYSNYQFLCLIMYNALLIEAFLSYNTFMNYNQKITYTIQKFQMFKNY